VAACYDFSGIRYVDLVTLAFDLRVARSQSVALCGDSINKRENATTIVRSLVKMPALTRPRDCDFNSLWAE